MKYFIDCGTHLFQGLKQFNQKYQFDDSWKIYTFEANPRTFEKSKNFLNDGLEKLDITHQNLAVSDHDGEIVVNCDSNNDGGTGQGSNILLTPPEKDIVHIHTFTWEKEKTNCFDLSAFIKQLPDIEKLVIKMDIEGSEFDVLKKIIADNTYEEIDEMYVEFHERFFLNNLKEYADLKQELINFFLNNEVRMVEWF